MGKITAIEVQKRNKKRCNIYIDGEYSFSISNELVYRNGLKNNMEIDEERFLEIAKEDSFLKCKETALRIIERSYKSEKEMKEKLLEKGYELEEINRTMAFLIDYNFINNKAYAEMYVKDRLRNQGSKKIKYALLRKGIEENIIEEVIGNINNENEELVALELGKKKYTQLIKKEGDPYKIKNKILMFLVGRGYEYSLAKDIVNRIINNEY